MEPISPELVLVDPELARRARALLPVPSIAPELVRDVAEAAQPSTPRGARIRGAFMRVASWLVVPSIALNIAFLRTDSAAEPTRAPAAPSPVQTGAASTSAPAPAPPARPRAKQRKQGVAAARHEVKPRRHTPVVRGVVRWPAAADAVAYDVVVWRDHRRIADVWTSKPEVEVEALACDGRRSRVAGRYLWFVYPLVESRPRRYGRLAKWGEFAVTPGVRCQSAIARS